MELLIPGLILVALMVYASTRIKRNAAAAFEAERIETDEFSVQKPEGFLHVINGDPKYALEFYSKAFGTGDAANIKAAEATLTLTRDRSAEALAGETIEAATEIIDDINEIVADEHYRVIESRRPVDGTGRFVWTKLAEKQGRAFKFEAVALEDTTPEARKDIEAMVDSFQLK